MLLQVDLLIDPGDQASRIAHLLVRLRAPQGEASGERGPVNLALVIDRSSSMRGPRLAQAIRAATQLVAALDERDRLAIITFDARARVEFGPAPVTDEVKPMVMIALDEIRSGVGTNLAAGIKKGAEALRSGFVRNAVSRLVLLTDGQPSIGVCDPQRLGQLVSTESARGVTCTAMGLGDGFDDELLAELARLGRGGFYYLAGAGDIPAAFGRELDGVFAIAATDVELKLIPNEDVVSVELLHRLESRPLDDGLVVSVGELATGAPRQVLFGLHRVAEPASNRCGTLAVSYRKPDGSSGDGHVLGVELPALPLSEDARVVTLERLRLEVASAVDAAWARRASGDAAHALRAMQQVAAEVSETRDQGRADVDALGELLADIEAAVDAVATSSVERERARRSMRERSHITLLGHSTVQPLPRDED